MKAIVVDDSSAARFFLSKMLKQLGYEIEEADHGESALEVLSGAEGIELALVDWNMPVMNGLTLVEELRKDSKYNDMKIVMVTTETEMTQVVKAIEAGANEYVMKPFTKEIIEDKLKLIGLLND